MKRASNIELLRCLLILMVIISHYTNFGGALKNAPNGSINYFFILLVQAFSVCAVDCFMLISGYFLCEKSNRNIRKPINLILIVMGYNFLLRIISISIGIDKFHIGTILKSIIPTNYYAILYCTLFLISPFMNIVIKSLNKRQYQLLLVIIIGLFIIWPTVTDSIKKDLIGISTISAYGNDAGYTIVNFSVLYFIGGYIRKWFVKNESIKIWICAYLISVSFIFFESIFTTSAHDYSNIFVVLNAVSLFMIFSKIKLNYNLIINKFSKTTFGIFCIHTNGLMLNSFWKLFNIPQYSKGSFYSCMLNLIISVLAMYFVCAFVDMIIRRMVTPVTTMLDKIKAANLSFDINVL